MAKVKFKGEIVHTIGELPKVGSVAPPFTLVGQDLAEVTLKSFHGKQKLLNIFPSLDTSVCATSVETFDRLGKALPRLVVLNISMDLPFAAGRFCASKGLKGARTLSAFRSTFPTDYGVLLTDGPLKGLLARATLLLDEQGKVLYAAFAEEITHEPDYQKALSFATA